MKRNKKRYLTGVLLLILATFIYIEAQPYEVVSSSVFSSSDLTETPAVCDHEYAAFGRGSVICEERHLGLQKNKWPPWKSQL